MKKLLNALTNFKLILLIQLAASVILGYSVFKANVIPNRYVAIMIGVLVVLFILVLLLTFKPSKIIRSFIGRFISIILSMVLLMGSSYVSQGDETIKKISGKTTTTVQYNVYVLKDSKYNELKDLKDKTIGVVPTVSEDAFQKSTGEIQEQISYTTQNYSSVVDSVKGLNDKNVDAILMDAAYENVVEDDYGNFTNDTRIIWSYTVTISEDIEKSSIDFTKKPFTLLISGSDSRSSVSVTSRSDVNMLVTINPKTKQILMTSIPRDYFVYLANTDFKYRDKLTHAGLQGVNNVSKTITNFMKVDIDCYVRVNFTVLEDLVNAIGGVRVYSDKAFIPWTNNAVRIQKGWQTMDGATALAFARERKTYSEGDRHRAANQQAVLKAIINKVSSSTSILTNYSSILKAIEGNLQTNVTTAQIKKLVKFQLDKMPSWQILNSVLTGTEEKRTGGYAMPSASLFYFIPNEKSIEENRQYILDMKAGKKITVKVDNTLTSQSAPEAE